MDRLTVKVLKYLRKQNEPVCLDKILDLYGKTAQKSIEYLESQGYATDKKVFGGMEYRNGKPRPAFVSNRFWEITSKVIDFIQHKPGQDFDRWATRLVAIWGAITGTIALLLELWQRFL